MTCLWLTAAAVLLGLYTRRRSALAGYATAASVILAIVCAVVLVTQ